jgi:hypothetical protein
VLGIASDLAIPVFFGPAGESDHQKWQRLDAILSVQDAGVYVGHIPELGVNTQSRTSEHLGKAVKSAASFLFR